MTPLLVTGAVDVADAPPQYRAVAATFVGAPDAAVLRQVGISVPSGDEDPVDHDSPPTTSVPISPTAGSVPSSPTGGSLEVVPLVSEGAPTSPHGPVPADVRGKPPLPVPPLAATDNGTEVSAADAPPGNGNAGGNGNSYGRANGHGNGNAYGHGDVHGAGEMP